MVNASTASEPSVVVSAVNVFSAGPLSIVRDFLAALLERKRREAKRFRLFVLAHKASLYADLGKDFEIVEFPRARRTWFHRLYYEYFGFRRWSHNQPVHTWLSLHDMTPSVAASHRVVYCHHATPFYEGPHSKFTTEWRFWIQRRLYSLFYARNIHKNDFVIVQQQWLRNAFVRRFNLDPRRVIVCTPSVKLPALSDPPAGPDVPGRKLLFYPAFPRFFKNIEVLIEAIRPLQDIDVRLVLTFEGNENAYARAVRTLARGTDRVEFRGFISRDEVFALYKACDAMVFPSRLESFGLPLKEIQLFDRPVFAADLPYAREALSGYGRACFFNPDDATALSRLLREFFQQGRFTAQASTFEYQEPYARGWDELITLLQQRQVLP